MARGFLKAGITAALLAFAGLSAADDQATVVSSSGGPSVFTAPVVLRGSLGESQVQFNLRPKTEFEGGVEGEYFVFGSSRKVLLAGETEDENVFMEESENGTDVSGQWEGQVSGDRFRGEWTSADGSVHKPFDLKVVTLPAATPASTFVRP